MQQSEIGYKIRTWYGADLWVTEASIRRDGSLTQAADELLRMREQDNHIVPRELRAGFDGIFGTAAQAEIMVGAWLHAVGDDTNAARLVLPVIAKLRGPAYFDEVTRYSIARIHYMYMTSAMRRQLDVELLTWAERLASDLFAGSALQGDAKEVISQLQVPADPELRIPADPERQKPLTDHGKGLSINFLNRRQEILFYASHLSWRNRDFADHGYMAAAIGLKYMHLSPAEFLPLVPLLRDGSFTSMCRKRTKYSVCRLVRVSEAVSWLLEEPLGVDTREGKWYVPMDEASRDAAIIFLTQLIASKCSPNSPSKMPRSGWGFSFPTLRWTR
ncbi:MAG TPA: hypothetical protein ENJ18_13305 [Nannocystis exedens]|nr:hypothetical protein [Nannocystis exedens]